MENSNEQQDKLQEIIKRINLARKLSVSLDKIPLNDIPAYKLIGSGSTEGLVHLDSRGMCAVLRRLKPENIGELAAFFALYRPGPMESGMLETFVERKNAATPVYVHRRLEPILKETYGLIVYREQLMAIAQQLARFTQPQTDTFLSYISRKRPEELKTAKKIFLTGCIENEIYRDSAAEIFDQITQSIAYTFRKTVAESKALVAYQSAYLKANYPKEYAA